MPKDDDLSIAGLGQLNPKAWFALPLTLRQRYWVETDYGRHPPPEPLLQEIYNAMNAHAESKKAQHKTTT